MPGFDLVIFDCDGVLVDSEKLAAAVWRAYLGEHGLQLSTEEIVHKYAGKTDGALAAAIGEEYGIFFQGHVAGEIEKRCDLLFDRELAAVCGVADLIRSLARPCCVCTNSGARRLYKSLRRVGLLDLFEKQHLFHAALVSRPKPAPDLHLFAAEKFGVTPARCLIIEDSVTGVSAGVEAGMTVYGFVGTSHLKKAQAERLKAAGAVRVFENMYQLHQILIQQEMGCDKRNGL